HRSAAQPAHRARSGRPLTPDLPAATDAARGGCTPARDMIPDRLVLATANPGKIAELPALGGGWGPVETPGLDTLAGVVLPPEGETSYEENAVAKARAVAVASGLPALGDDSGLEVDALGGGPGVLSARLAATDGERIAALLARLTSARDRRARFRC